MIIQITDKKRLEITELSSRSLSLRMNNIKPLESRTYYEEFNQTFYTEEITQLKFEGKDPYIIKLGDTITINRVIYNINKIICGRDYEYILIDQELNKSTKYILPLIVPINSYATEYLFNSCLYNTYLHCNKYPLLSNNKYLFIKYRFYDIPTYKIFESSILKQKNFVLTDDSEKGFTTFVLDIGEEFNSTVDLFNLGKYHVFKEEHDTRILNFFIPSKNGREYGGIYNQIKQCLTKDINKIKQLESKLGMELPEGIGLDSKPEIIKETLKL